MGNALRFTEIEEVPRRPFPARIVYPRDLVKEDAQALWLRIADVLDDRARNHPEVFFGQMVQGNAFLIEIGNKHGLIWLYDMDRGRSASISIAIWGDWREYARVYGKPRDGVPHVLRWLMDEFDLKRLRSYVMESNTPGQRIVERAGFKREGQMRREFLKGGVDHDLIVFGLLREEI